MHYSKFTNNNSIKIKWEIDEKNYLYSYCINCCFKNFETIDIKGLSDLFKILTIYETVLSYCLGVRKLASKNTRLAKKNKGNIMLLSKLVV